MHASDLLERLEQRGFSLERDGDQLIISPAEWLTEELRSLIRAHKPELLVLLNNDSADDWPGGLIRFDWDWSNEPNRTCEDCGRPLEPHRLIRCDTCVLADWRRQREATP